MKLAWGPLTQLYSRHIYVLVNSVFSFNQLLGKALEEARGELLFWQHMPRLRFEAEIWPCLEGLSIGVAADASDFAWW